MLAQDIQLPGGLLQQGSLEKQVHLHPLDGRLQLRLAEIVKAEEYLPQRVTEILVHAVRAIGNYPVQREQITELCVADRQYLMLYLARLLDGDELWLQAHCHGCEKAFDLQLRRSALPVKQAGQGFPFTTATVQGHTLKLRVPTGAVQERIVASSEAEALKTLLHHSIVEVDKRGRVDDFINTLDSDAIDLIDAALDDVTPDIGTRLATQCPECGLDQVVSMNPYNLSVRQLHELYQEIHALAYYYHWSEEAILALPQERRHLYLHMINRTRGLHG